MVFGKRTTELLVRKIKEQEMDDELRARKFAAETHGGVVAGAAMIAGLLTIMGTFAFLSFMIQMDLRIALLIAVLTGITVFIMVLLKFGKWWFARYYKPHSPEN